MVNRVKIYGHLEKSDLVVSVSRSDNFKKSAVLFKKWADMFKKSAVLCKKCVEVFKKYAVILRSTQ